MKQSLARVHYSAWAVALACFPLIWMGGLVTSKGAGMSVPDWPNSFGYNMFLLPPSMWLTSEAGGIFYEHAHRLLGTLVGLLSLILVAVAWGTAKRPKVRKSLLIAAATLFVGGVVSGTVWGISGLHWMSHVTVGFICLAIGVLIFALPVRQGDQRPWVRWLTLALLVAVILQGLKGGLRVTEVSLGLALAHGVFGQIVFTGACLIVLVTSRFWTKAVQLLPREVNLTRRWAYASALLVGLCLTQLVLGATMRHDKDRLDNLGGPGLAIPDWPLHYGNLLPPTNADALRRVNQIRPVELKMKPVTMGEIWLHFSHRMGAYVTVIVGLSVSMVVLIRLRRHRAIAINAGVTLVLLLTQATLGVVTVLWRKPADIATAHQAVGALLLMSCGLLLAQFLRMILHARPAIHDSDQAGATPHARAARFKSVTNTGHAVQMN